MRKRGCAGAGWFIELFWASITHLSLFSYDLRPVMWFSACLLATAALLPPATNGSPTSILPSFLTSWSEGLNSLRRVPNLNVDDTTELERRQAANAFDHNPDGSQFLWVLQDTYQGKTFFECVAARRANSFRSLVFFSTAGGRFSRGKIQPSKPHLVLDGDDGR